MLSEQECKKTKMHYFLQRFHLKVLFHLSSHQAEVEVQVPERSQHSPRREQTSLLSHPVSRITRSTDLVSRYHKKGNKTRLDSLQDLQPVKVQVVVGLPLTIYSSTMHPTSKRSLKTMVTRAEKRSTPSTRESATSRLRVTDTKLTGE